MGCEPRHSMGYGLTMKIKRLSGTGERPALMGASGVPPPPPNKAKALRTLFIWRGTGGKGGAGLCGPGSSGLRRCTAAYVRKGDGTFLSRVREWGRPFPAPTRDPGVGARALEAPRLGLESGAPGSGSGGLGRLGRV